MQMDEYQDISTSDLTYSIPSEDKLETPELIIEQFKLVVPGKEPEELLDRLNKTLIWLAPELLWNAFFKYCFGFQVNPGR